MSLFKMAWRNIWRNRRRTIVTVAAMSLALLVMILYSGLVAGYLNGLERNVLELEIGDLQVFTKNYQDEPSLYERIETEEQILAKLDRAGFRTTARLLGFGLAAAGDSSAGVSFRGVDIARDAAVSKVNQRVLKGTWLDPADPQGVVVGRRLAFTLDIKPGAELVVLAQGADGSMANELYKVRGILGGINDSVDRGGVFMLASSFRELMVVPKGVHQLILKRPPGLPLKQAAEQVRALVPQLKVQTWRQLVPTIASMLESTRGMIYIMFLLVYIAIGIVILNAMLMAVFERIREFGVLKALGMGPWAVFRLIMLESSLQTGLAVLTGVCLSLPGVWYLSETGIDMGILGGMSVAGISWDSTMRASVSAGTFSGPIIMLVAVVTTAVLYPAIKAAMIRPISAMQHQ